MELAFKIYMGICVGLFIYSLIGFVYLLDKQDKYYKEKEAKRKKASESDPVKFN